jgi:hypothetical protein
LNFPYGLGIVNLDDGKNPTITVTNNNNNTLQSINHKMNMAMNLTMLKYISIQSQTPFLASKSSIHHS